MTQTAAENKEHISQRIKEYDQLELTTCDYSILDTEQHIDPDINFFPSSNNTCHDYTSDQHNCNINLDDKLSIIHFNSRSLFTNFVNIKDYLHSFSHPFSIIAVSETWINKDKGVDFELNDHELSYNNRQSKGGGGVAIYVHRDVSFKVVEAMTVGVENVLECITVEICIDNGKNAIVSCIYKTPGSSVDVFREWMESVFMNIANKNIFICGDFNIDLLNPSNHRSTEDFINAMQSMSLLPTITKPTRVTSHSATIIDNIFTNVIDNKTNGILISDISDHLPVFTVFDMNYRNKIDNHKQFRRRRNEESLTALKQELITKDWDNVYNAADVNSAYNAFISLFLTLYNKHCPIIEYNKRKAYNNCPWLTKGLQNACKKKNSLYKNFIRQRTEMAEKIYIKTSQLLF